MTTATPSIHMNRISPRLLAATFLGVVLTLSVALQLLPAISRRTADDAAHATTVGALDIGSVLVAVFVVAGALFILFVATVLVGCTRKQQH